MAVITIIQARNNESLDQGSENSDRKKGKIEAIFKESSSVGSVTITGKRGGEEGNS